MTARRRISAASGRTPSFESSVIARRAEYLPWLWASLTTARVAERFAHFLRGDVERWSKLVRELDIKPE